MASGDTIRDNLMAIRESGQFDEPLPDEIEQAIEGKSLDELVEFITPGARNNMPAGLDADSLMQVLGRFWDAAGKLGLIRHRIWFDKKLNERQDNLDFPACFGADQPMLCISLKENFKEFGKPWVISYVQELKIDQPLYTAQAIEKFAWLGPWEEFLSELADAALPEQWDFSDPDPNRPYEILKSYITTTFFRLQQEGKICTSEEDGFAAFNTGLVDGHYNDIYATFVPNSFEDRAPWKFYGFASKKRRDLKKRLSKTFHPLPARAKYIEGSIAELLFDPDRALQVDYEHIVLDNIARLPEEFLLRYAVAGGNERAIGLIRQMEASPDEESRNELAEQLGDVIDEDDALFRAIEGGLSYAVDIAVRRVKWNFKTAIPTYYPKGNKMSHLLPLCLCSESEADAALVAEFVQSGIYQGQTILTMKMAYKNARLICRPDSDWLTPSIQG